MDPPIEDLVVNDKEVQTTETNSTDTFQQIHDRVDRFLKEECPSLIQSLESKYQ